MVGSPHPSQGAEAKCRALAGLGRGLSVGGGGGIVTASSEESTWPTIFGNFDGRRGT